MDFRAIQNPSRFFPPAELSIDASGGVLQAARLWSAPRHGPRAFAGPSRAILGRAERVQGILDALKDEVRGMDNASKAAACSLLV